MRPFFLPFMHRIAVKPLLAATIAGTCVLGHGAIAHADSDRDDTPTVLALDLDFAAPLAGVDVEPGGGGALRFGRKYSLFLASLTPELGVSYHRFRGVSDTRVYRGFVGGRVGLGTIVEPSAFAHVGLSRLETVEAGHFAPQLDAGLALDFTLLPLIDLGAHGSYNSVLPQSGNASFSWISVGVHAALVF